MATRALLKEPLVHFLLIGAGLFLLYGWGNGPAALQPRQGLPLSTQIIVSQEELKQMVDTFERTWQRAPTEDEVESLIEGFVRDEIYYREAVTAGLDRDDGVIRRRLRLKMEYLFENLADQVETTDQELREFMEKRADAYHVDPRITFRHIFIHPDRRRGEVGMEVRTILDRLAAGTDPDDLGEPFLLGHEFQAMPLWEVRGQFGEAFAKTLFAQEPGRWSGPLESGFGRHLVRVEQVLDGGLPSLTEIRDVIKRDWAQARQQELKDEAYERLRERYTVLVEPAEIETLSKSASQKLKVVNR